MADIVLEIWESDIKRPYENTTIFVIICISPHMDAIVMTDRRTVNPNVVRQLREGKRLARTRLAAMAKLSERQLRRIEDNDARAVSVRDNTLMNLARALEVEPSVLTGESPAPRVTPRPAPTERSPIRAMIEPKARLGYTLLKQRYGVNATDLINMAPLFFTLLAEGSLAWRREQLEAAEEAMWRASALGKGHLACMNAVHHAEEGLSRERQSIEAFDLFGEKIADDAYQWGYDTSTNNPFTDYLRKLANDLGKPDVVSVGHSELGFMSLEYPDYDLCGSELDVITNHSSRARWALDVGHARLDQLPAELRGEDAAEQRAAWIEGQAPPPPADESALIDSLPDADAVEELVQKRQQGKEADLSDLLPPDDGGIGDDS